MTGHRSWDDIKKGFAGNGIRVLTDKQLDHALDEDEPDKWDVEPVDPDRPWTTEEKRSARSRAQSRAKTQLAHEFRFRYRMLYAQELEREGLHVTRHGRVGSPASKTLAREGRMIRPASPDQHYYYPDEEKEDES